MLPIRVSGDPAVAAWFLGEGDRANAATDLRAFTTGNLVEPLIDGRSYFARLGAELGATEPGDQVYFLDFRGDLDERLDGPGSEVGAVLSAAALRKVLVFGMLWRSQPKLLKQSEETNAEFVRELDDAGGQVLLDGRTRRAGSHHQKLVIVRHPAAPERDAAFVGGIDLGFSRNDDSEHGGDPQVMEFPDGYGARPPWHDIQAAVHGPAVHDLEHTFRERWYGSSVLDLPSPVRQLYDRAYHIGAMTSRPLPEPGPTTGTRAARTQSRCCAPTRPGCAATRSRRTGNGASRTPTARRSRGPGGWSTWRTSTCGRGRWRGSSPPRCGGKPGLYVIAVVPRFPDHDGTVTGMPGLVARHDLMRACAAAGGDRFAVYDLENRAGTPVYVHAKVVVADDVWAMVGSDNLNRRSWSHDSELSIAVLDAERDARPPLDPAGLGDGARTFARDLRLRLWREHLDRGDADADVANLLDPAEAFAAFRRQALALEAWHAGGQQGERPAGRVRPHQPHRPTAVQRLWAAPLYRLVYDPDGRPWRDRLRGRL